jgi:subtilisin family serine protease
MPGRRLFRITAWLWFAVMACASATPAAAQAMAGASARQILVLLKQAPAHYRPDADYGGGYGDVLSRSARQRLGRRIARSHGLTLVGNWPMPLLGLDCFIMGVPDGETPEQAANRVSQDPGVEWSEPMHVYQTKGGGAAYNDPLYPAEPAARLWHLADLHQMATGRGVTVAVIDTQIEARHPDLVGQVAIEQDFTAGHPAGAETHGTGVAGIIAARADNGLGIVGVAPHARLIGLRACWQLPGDAGSVCDSLSLAKALHFAIEHRVQVINLSLSGPQDMLLGKLIDVGRARGAAVVAAYDAALPGGGFPASHPGVIAVADESLAPPPPGVYSAPGRDVPTTQPGGRWYLVNGSSFAAAHVSGLIALLREHHEATAAAPVSLVAAHGDGGPIDAMATLLRTYRPCDPGCVRQVAANLHP